MLKFTLRSILAATTSLKGTARHFSLWNCSSQDLQPRPQFLPVGSPTLAHLHVVFLTDPNLEVKVRKVTVSPMVQNHGPIRDRILSKSPDSHCPQCVNLLVVHFCQSLDMPLRGDDKSRARFGINVALHIGLVAELGKHTLSSSDQWHIPRIKRRIKIA